MAHRRLRIGVDVDGVLAEQVPPILQRIHQRYGVPLTKDQIVTWNHPIPGIASDLGKEIERGLEEEEYVASMDPVDGAAQAVAALQALGHTIVIATARPSGAEGWTRTWLQRHGFRFDEYVNTRGRGKGILDADVLVDDFPDNLRDFARPRRSCILYHQPWNVGEVARVQQEISDFHAAPHWAGVLGIVASIARR